jgi:hypothetical protein
VRRNGGLREVPLGESAFHEPSEAGMSDVKPERPRDAVLYCERLLGLQSDCNIPYCPEREISTGWLLSDAGTRSWSESTYEPPGRRSARPLHC